MEFFIFLIAILAIIAWIVLSGWVGTTINRKYGFWLTLFLGFFGTIVACLLKLAEKDL